MEKTLIMSLLFDFYGPLLTERQQDIYQMYYHEDLSLGEISEQLSISRQAVYDILKRSKAALEEFEEKLQLVEKHKQKQQSLKMIAEQIALIQSKFENDTKLMPIIRQIRDELDRLLIDS